MIFIMLQKYDDLKKNYSLTPNFFNIIFIKHKLVNADCNKFAPTKVVNHNQLIFIFMANIRLIRIKVPAIPFIYLFIISFVFLVFKNSCS